MILLSIFHSYSIQRAVFESLSMLIGLCDMAIFCSGSTLLTSFVISLFILKISNQPRVSTIPQHCAQGLPVLIRCASPQCTVCSMPNFCPCPRKSTGPRTPALPQTIVNSWWPTGGAAIRDIFSRRCSGCSPSDPAPLKNRSTIRQSPRESTKLDNSSDCPRVVQLIDAFRMSRWYCHTV